MISTSRGRRKVQPIRSYYGLFSLLISANPFLEYRPRKACPYAVFLTRLIPFQQSNQACGEPDNPSTTNDASDSHFVFDMIVQTRRMEWSIPLVQERGLLYIFSSIEVSNVDEYAMMTADKTLPFLFNTETIFALLIDVPDRGHPVSVQRRRRLRV